jgi:hypothetical protein
VYSVLLGFGTLLTSFGALSSTLSIDNSYLAIVWKKYSLFGIIKELENYNF